MAATLKALEADRSVLVVDNQVDNRNLDLSSRNLPGVKLALSREVTVYDLLKHKYVLVSEQAARKLSEALS
jgi:large subunit ribosomal protein L4